MPKPNPTAVSDASTERAVVILFVKLSRMIPKASGITPPPRPCTTRAAISQPIDGASAAASEPSDSAASATTMIFFLPTTSPIRPSRGVAMEAESRYAVSTHVTVDWSVSYSCWICASTGTISDCSSAKAPTATVRTAKVIRCWRRTGDTREGSSGQAGTGRGSNAQPHDGPGHSGAAGDPGRPEG